MRRNEFQARTLPNMARRPLNVDRPATAGEAATLWVYDAIGRDPWTGEGVSAADFVRELAALKGTPVNLRINSPGGDVFEARAISTALRAHDAPVSAQIDGVAASAASFLALAAGRITIADGAFVMIHRAWSFVMGNAGDFLDMAATLEKLDGAIAADYSKRTGTDAAGWLDLMAATTWFSAAEALAANLVDEIVAIESASALWDPTDLPGAPQALIEAAARATVQSTAIDNVDPVNLADLVAEHEHRQRRAHLATLGNSIG